MNSGWLGAVFLHCPAKPQPCLLVLTALSPTGDQLKGCRKQLGFVELDGLHADPEFAHVIPSLAPRRIRDLISELLCARANLAETTMFCPLVRLAGLVRSLSNMKNDNRKVTGG